MRRELNISQIERIQKIYERIVSLDKSINDLEKLAALVSEKRTEINVSLSVKDTEAAKKEATKVKFDDDGSIIKSGETTGGMFASFAERYMMVYNPTSEKTDENSHTLSISWPIPDKTAFRLMGMLMQEKKQEREHLLNQLQSYGFKTN